MAVRCQLHVWLVLPLGTQPSVPLDKRLDVPRRRSGGDGKDKNFLPPPGIVTRILGHPARGLVTVPT